MLADWDHRGLIAQSRPAEGPGAGVKVGQGAYAGKPRPSQGCQRPEWGSIPRQPARLIRVQCRLARSECFFLLSICGSRRSGG